MHPQSTAVHLVCVFAMHQCSSGHALTSRVTPGLASWPRELLQVCAVQGEQRYHGSHQPPG